MKNGKIGFCRIFAAFALAASLCLSARAEAANFYADANGVLHIANRAGLMEFRDQANAGTIKGLNQTGGHTNVVLDADIDLSNEEWTPINTSCADFDGQNHVVANLKVTGNAKNVGLFGAASISTVKNLTVSNAVVVGINHVAAIAGDGLCGHFINCKVYNASITANVYNNDDGDKAGAICGYLSGESDAEVTDCTVENCTITGYRDIGGAVGYANGTARVTGTTVTDTKVINDRSVNYKNYTKDSEFDVHEVVGETNAKATVENNTATDVTVGVAVAKVNGATFASLVAAIAAVEAGDEFVTIQMIANEAFTGTNPLMIAAGKKIVLDLNGCTLSYVSENAVNQADAFIANYGDLTVTDTSANKSGVITACQQVDWGAQRATINNVGNLIVNEGKIENTSAAGLAWPIHNGAYGSTSSVVINGGTIHSVNYVPICEYLQCGGCKTLTINGGTLISDSSRAIGLQFMNATVEDTGSFIRINGGSFTANGEGKGIFYFDMHQNNVDTTGFIYEVNGGTFSNNGTNGTVAQYDYESHEHSSAVDVTSFIKGGTYNLDPTAHCAPGYAATKSGNNWVVGEVAAVAQVTIGQTVTSYGDLHAALEAAKNKGALCEMLADVDLTDVEWTPVADFNGRFDGANHAIGGLTVEGTAQLGLFANTGTEATIRDLTITGATITSTGGNNHGVLAGSISGSVISNVKVLNSTVTTDAGKGQYTGGLVGSGYPESCQCEIAGCTVTGWDQVGGLIGYLWVGYIENSIVTNNTVEAKSERAGGLVGKIQFAAGNMGSSSMWVNSNTISGTAKAPDMAGGIAGQIMGDCDKFSVKDNDVDVTLEAPQTSPIAVLRGDCADNAFTQNITTKISGNWWTDATYEENSYTFTNATIAAEKDYTVYRAVATIDETPYKSLAEAYDAAEAGDTVKIIVPSLDTFTIPSKVITVEGLVDANGNPATTVGDVTSGQLRGTIKNLLFPGKFRYVSIYGGVIYNCAFTGNSAIYECYSREGGTRIENCVFDPIKTYGINFGGSDCEVVVKDCDIKGWSSFSGAVRFDGCTFAKSRGGWAKLRFYEDSSVTDCTFSEDVTIDAGSDPYVCDVVVPLNGCAVNSSTKTLADIIKKEKEHPAVYAIDATSDDEGYTSGTIVTVRTGDDLTDLVSSTCQPVAIKSNVYRVTQTYSITYALGNDCPAGAHLPTSPTTYVQSATETTLPKPTYTSESVTFNGWASADPAFVGNSIPAGTTGALTLVAQWTSAQVIEVKTNATEQTPTVEIKVTEAWIEKNVEGPKTTENIQEKLNEEDPNGNLKWQNYVIGLEPTNQVAGIAEQNDDEKTITVVPNAMTPQADTGFTVRYSLDTVETNGTVVTEGAATTMDNLNIDLNAVESNAYFKVNVIVTKDGAAESEATKVVATNTLGVLKVNNAPKTAIVAVPWNEVGGENVTVSNLVKTANLNENDELYVYGENGEYTTWHLNADKNWVSSGEEGESASSVTVPRGSAVWLTRSDSTKPIVLFGQVAAQTQQAESTLEKRKDNGKPSWNIVAAPSVEALDLNEKFTAEAKTSIATDRVIVPTDGAPKTYTYDTANGTWGYNDGVTTTTNALGIIKVRSVRVTTDTKIPAGTGFMYLNSDENSTKVKW